MNVAIVILMFACAIVTVIFLSKIIKTSESKNSRKNDHSFFKINEERYKSYLISEFRIKKIENKDITFYIPQIHLKNWLGIKLSSSGNFSVWPYDTGSSVTSTEECARKMIEDFKIFCQKELDEMPQRIKNFDVLTELNKQYCKVLQAEIESNRPKESYINVM